jgi:hypothetical protein
LREDLSTSREHLANALGDGGPELVDQLDQMNRLPIEEIGRLKSIFEKKFQENPAIISLWQNCMATKRQIVEKEMEKTGIEVKNKFHPIISRMYEISKTGPSKPSKLPKQWSPSIFFDIR